VRRGAPFAVGTATAVAMLGFVLLFGARMGDPDRLVFSGWQVELVQWALLGLALLVALGAGAWSVLRLRGLQGEGLVLGPPALLFGLLLSGLPLWGAQHATSWAETQTSAYREAERMSQLEIRDLQKHPRVMHARQPAATPELAALLPHALELGRSWYPLRVPAATRALDRTSTDGASSLLQRATKAPTDGWDVQRLLLVTVKRYPDATRAAAAAAVYRRGPEGQLRHLVVEGTGFDTYRTRDQDVDRVFAVLRKGTLVWTLRLSDVASERLSDSEVQQLLGLVAAKAATAQ
jgi:hypothetical protein